MTEIILTEVEGREMDKDSLIQEVYLKQCPLCKTLYFNQILECVCCKIDLVRYIPLNKEGGKQNV